MSELVWDQVGDRLYETGVSKGVLYKDDGVGVAWNGLIAIEHEVPTEVEPVYFDGIKFNDIVTMGDCTAVLRAFTYPDEFQYYEGTLKDQTGFYVMNQRQSRFGLSYQTKIGDDINGIDAGYKIHVMFNLTAVPAQTSYETIGEDLEPIEFEWSITSIPEEIENYRPTAHIIFNSLEMDPNLLRDVEEILYGSETNEPRLPSLKSLATFIRKWDRLIITENVDGTWTAESNVEGIITMLDDTTFQIVSDTATYLDADTYEISSSEKNEEDIWQP